MSKGQEGQSADKVRAERARVHEHLAASEVEARAVFRSATASSRQIVGLEVGDVLLFNHPVAMPLTLQTGGVPIFDVTIGRVNRQLALQVAAPVPEDRHRRRSRLQVIDDAAS